MVNQIGAKGDTILLRCVGDRLHVLRKKAGSTKPETKFWFRASAPVEKEAADWLLRQLKRGTIFVVQVDATDALVQKLVLPREVLRSLQSYFEFEMDRLIPLRSSDVYFDYRLDSALTGEKVTVSLFVILRSKVAEHLGKLSHLPVQPHQLDIVRQGDGDESPGCGVNLLPNELRARKSRRGLLSNVTAAFVALMALLSVNLILLESKEQKIDLLASKMPESEQSQASIIRLTERLKTAEKASSYVFEQKTKYPPITEILQHLTVSLPRHSFVQQLYVSDGNVEIHGLSESAAELVPLLEGTPWFQDVTLRSPITQDQDSSKERYKIRMQAATPSSRRIKLALTTVPGVIPNKVSLGASGVDQ